VTYSLRHVQIVRDEKAMIAMQYKVKEDHHWAMDALCSSSM